MSATNETGGEERPRIAEILGRSGDELLEGWLAALDKAGVRRQELIGENELREQSGVRRAGGSSSSRARRGRTP